MIKSIYLNGMTLIDMMVDYAPEFFSIDYLNTGHVGNHITGIDKKRRIVAARGSKKTIMEARTIIAF
ncbi:hypothetical protein FSB73_19290 [Arachidicoccus ginsenosidivorans]|uniref:Uncharacterized protein n=1 Tax=Arachidicoccus ginsenosidivorans TaxID=496057 RepID=A0A5B8VRF5_9BACT|nr:hypothetical protein [Arachidicoccus ginsenosidivorans]QEC73482.1 hypothetical protein FSB73_19290 [Arachidicoccus ginsenosidivorans]